MFDLRVEIYRKLVLEEEKSKFEESIEERVKLKNQEVNFPITSEQKKFNDFLKQIKEEQKNIGIVWFKRKFNYEKPDKMLEYLHSSKTTDDYDRATSLTKGSFTDFKDVVEDMSERDENNMGIKIFDIVDKILEFALEERKQGGQ